MRQEFPFVDTFSVAELAFLSPETWRFALCIRNFSRTWEQNMSSDTSHLSWYHEWYGI